jgi:hypothetical protein
MKNISHGIISTYAAIMITAAQALASEGSTTSSGSPENIIPLSAGDEAYVQKWESFLSDYQNMLNAAQNDQSHKPFTLDQVNLVTPEKLPKFGTFWSLQGRPPLPFNLFDNTFTNAQVNVYALPNGAFVLDDADVDYEAIRREKLAALRSAMGANNAAFDLDEDSGSSGMSMLRTAEQFMAQTFSLIDTNDAAANDTNLFGACIFFPDDTNTYPTLQIKAYGNNAVIIKANHFDYSAETDRDFALLVCDSVDKPLWKSIDFAGASDSEDGWLVQGSVPNWKVADPMFLLVSNITKADNAFFRAIPYGGPIVQLTGPQPYDIVSNTITLQASITDLSGVTNVQFEVTVNGDQARYSFGTNNTISLETKYNPNGDADIYLKAFNRARILDPANPPDNARLFFAGGSSLPLYFENDTYLLWASDYCSPDVGTNYFYYVTDRPQTITASIYDPSDGHAVKSFGGYVPYPATISLSWNFTEADGVTPYSNDTYAVTFQTSNPTTLNTTNNIERNGVRTATGNILTYEKEDPSLSAGPYLNSQANTWVGSIAAAAYEALYYWDFASITQYSPSDIGANRDNPAYLFPDFLTQGNETNWVNRVCSYLTNVAFSDFTYYMGHANGFGLGGGPSGTTWVKDWVDSGTIKTFVASAAASPNWRMRKVALWACYTDSPAKLSAGGTYPTWAEAFGIRTTRLQRSSWSAKNVGLFFGGNLSQGPYSGTFGGTSPEVAVNFDDLWVTGPTPFPGACDPTYAFSWVFNQIRGMSPELDEGLPAWIGFGYLPYTAIYDGELVTNNVSHIKR